MYCYNPYFFQSMDGCQPFFYFTPYPPFFHGVISHFLFYIPAAKASCCTANPHCPLIELLEIKKTKLTKSGEISSQYLCLYEAWRNSYPWLPLHGDMAVCMLNWGTGQAVGWCVCAPSLRTVDAFPVVTSLPPKNFGGREATTGNASAVRRLVCPLLFVCVAGMGYFRVTLPKPLFQSEAKWEAIK